MTGTPGCSLGGEELEGAPSSTSGGPGEAGGGGGAGAGLGAHPISSFSVIVGAPSAWGRGGHMDADRGLAPALVLMPAEFWGAGEIGSAFRAGPEPLRPLSSTAGPGLEAGKPPAPAGHPGGPSVPLAGLPRAAGRDDGNVGPPGKVSRSGQARPLSAPRRPGFLPLARPRGRRMPAAQR